MSQEKSVKVRYVQRVKTPDGRQILYFRKGDYRYGPLQSDDGTPALAAEVAAILQKIEKTAALHNTPKPGTIGGMALAYARSSEFRALAPITRSGYQAYIDEMIADIGEVRLSEVTRSFVIELRDAWAERGHNSANKRMQVLRNILSPAIDDDTDKRIEGDPFLRVAKVKRPHDAREANPSWEDSEVEVAIADALARNRPGLARAIALGRWGGFRKGTVCAIPLNARIVRTARTGTTEARLVWITEKRKVKADKREDQRLTDLLASTPDRALTIAYNRDGTAWRERGLSQALERHMDRLAQAGKVRSVITDEGKVRCPLTFHGLRHARGVELALAGASDSEIMSQLEHTTEAAAKIYRRQADRRRMADAAQDKIDNVINLHQAALKKTATQA